MTVEQTGAETQGSDSAAVDAALAGIGESPMPQGEGEGPTEAAPQEQQAPVWNGEEWAFESFGKRVIPDSRETFLKYAQQGHGYSQKMGELNKTHAQRMQEAEAREAKAKELEQKYSPFAPLEEYAQKNPGWIEHVNKAYQESLAKERGLDPKIAEALTPIQQELAQLRQEREEKRALEEQQKLEAQYQEEDKALDAEIQSTRKLPEFANIDWNAKDESGETLETRICKHGIDGKIQSFKAAARDYLFPQLLTQQGAQNRLQAVRTQQTQAKAGILGQTQAPTKELKSVDVKRPWSDPAFDVQAILQEHRQVNGGTA